MNKGLLTVQDVKNFIFEAISINGSTHVVTCRQLLKIFKIDHRRLQTYLKEGMPFILKGTRKYYNLLDIKRWLVEQNKLTYHVNRMEKENELS